MPSKPEQGYWLNFAPASDDSVHEFCGPNEIEGASCPNCSKPLLRLLSLAAADSRLDLDPSKATAIPLLYCWTCSIPFGVFCYRVQQNGSVEILNVPPIYEYAFGPDGPYDGYTGHFPLKRVGLSPLTENEQRKQAAAQSSADLTLNLLPFQKHQVGGLPVIANSEHIVCPVCSKDSPLLAIVCDTASGNKSQKARVPAHETFTDNAGTQMVFHLCRDCSVISAYHSND